MYTETVRASEPDGSGPGLMRPEGSGPGLMQPEEAAWWLRVSRTTVFELLKSGELASVKIGRSRRISRADFELYVERLRSEQTRDPAAA